MQTVNQEATDISQVEPNQAAQAETVMSEVPRAGSSAAIPSSEAQTAPVSRFGNKSTRQLALIAMIFIAFIALGLARRPAGGWLAEHPYRFWSATRFFWVCCLPPA